mgnify:CR=1 FL=1
MLSTTPTRRPGTRGSRAARDIFQSKSAGGTVRSAQKHAAPLFCAARNLALLQEFCAQQGTSFLFVCAPNKNTSYPEYMPGQYRKTEQVSDLDRLEQALTQQGVSFCDLREALSGRESLTYYRTDSHWNGYGSYLAGRQILQALGKEADTEDVSLSMQQHAGDLYGMLYPASDRKEDAPAPAQLRTFSYLGDVRGADDQLIRTQSGAEGTLFMFRDSFGNALHADLAGQFSQAVFSRSMPYDLSQAEEMPEVLIAEIAQRNLRWLAQRPPLLPAPQRQVPVWEREAQQKLSVSVSESGFEGLFCYEGRFPEPPDTDAAVFACVDGVWYESCLTEDGFRLLAGDYILTAESRVINYWAFGITLFMMLFVLGIFIKLYRRRS